MFTETTGNLLQFAREGKFDLVAHGCNCIGIQKAGIARSMVEEFATDTFPMEHPHWYKGAEYLKLGNIDWREIYYPHINKNVTVINCYTQYLPGKPGKYGIPLEYDHLASCFDKINFLFKGKTLGLPWIGCGLAGGDIDKVRRLIKQKLTDLNTILVKYEPES